MICARCSIWMAAGTVSTARRRSAAIRWVARTMQPMPCSMDGSVSVPRTNAGQWNSGAGTSPTNSTMSAHSRRRCRIPTSYILANRKPTGSLCGRTTNNKKLLPLSVASGGWYTTRMRLPGPALASKPRFLCGPGSFLPIRSSRAAVKPPRGMMGLYNQATG